MRDLFHRINGIYLAYLLQKNVREDICTWQLLLNQANHELDHRHLIGFMTRLPAMHHKTLFVAATFLNWKYYAKRATAHLNSYITLANWDMVDLSHRSSQRFKASVYTTGNEKHLEALQQTRKQQETSSPYYWALTAKHCIWKLSYTISSKKEGLGIIPTILSTHSIFIPPLGQNHICTTNQQVMETNYTLACQFILNIRRQAEWLLTNFNYEKLFVVALLLELEQVLF